MSTTLTGHDGAGVYLDGYHWLCVCRIGMSFGWKPTGTVPFQSDGGYLSPAEGQTVTEADGAALADALDRALPDIPAFDIECDLPNALEEFAGAAGRALLQDIAAFIRRGPFTLSHEESPVGHDGDDPGIPMVHT
ncbi:MAG: hypothetical protein HZB26_07250 [Candidatus Hydrogenedentes bacterium]|nr:hypothetical protein [Candidatus Hydrogenedentota bacterium]